jgi:hypothetical protein
VDPAEGLQPGDSHDIFKPITCPPPALPKSTANLQTDSAPSDIMRVPLYKGWCYYCDLLHPHHERRLPTRPFTMSISVTSTTIFLTLAALHLSRLTHGALMHQLHAATATSDTMSQALGQNLNSNAEQDYG